MKTHFISIIAAAALATLGLSSCIDDHDAPNTDDYIVTSPVSVGEVNTDIKSIKAKYCASSTGADFVRTSSNWYTKVTEDLVFEAVVVANDKSGNLYQTLLLRQLDAQNGIDQCILLSIKNTCLYPYFRLGQRLRINLKDLYVGVYSKTPKIGRPYYTSYGNLNLGPMLMNLCKTNIELVGEPDPNAPELVPVVPTDAWLRATANRTYENCPMLATVSGKIQEVDGDNVTKPAIGEVTGKAETIYHDANGNPYKIFAPEVLHDNGYGVDRTIMLQTNTSKVALRTSTENEIAYSRIPTDVRSYTGVLSYYDGWQIQLRDLDDISPALN